MDQNAENIKALIDFQKKMTHRGSVAQVEDTDGDYPYKNMS